MGWFSKKPSEAKMVGSEAGKAARAQLLLPFSLTAFLEAGDFTPPPDFFRDPYVVGFWHGFVVCMADRGSTMRRKHRTENDKMELISTAVEATVGPAG